MFLIFFFLLLNLSCTEGICGGTSIYPWLTLIDILVDTLLTLDPHLSQVSINTKESVDTRPAIDQV